MLQKWRGVSDTSRQNTRRAIMSRIRNTDYNTVHHLTSRIAHRAYFLKEEARNDFLSLTMRVSAFSGVELLGWCIMDNHFHLYVYLPEPPTLSDEEVIRRYHLLKGYVRRLLSDEDDDRIVNPYTQTGAACPTPRASSDGFAKARVELIRSIRRRMYSIAEYMRMIKKWFSDDYNENNGHKGTMWEAIYGDSDPFYLPEFVEEYTDLRDRLAYIHLNPVRAAIVSDFSSYPWSSYTAFRKGDPVAVAAMRRAYPGMTDEDVVLVHEERMSRLLEDWKRKRAEEIARKRDAGYSLPPDPLTDECMVAQAREQIERVRKQVVELQLEREVTKGTKRIRSIIQRQILALVSVYPDMTPQSYAKTLKVPLRSIQRYLASLIRDGLIKQTSEGLSSDA